MLDLRLGGEDLLSVIPAVYPRVINGVWKGIWPKLLPCTRKIPLTAEPL